MGNPLAAIGDIADAFSNYKVNAVGVKDGQYVDAQGNPTTLYSPPNFFQKLGSTGGALARMNTEGAASGLIAQKNAFNQRGAAMAIDPTLTPETYADTYNPLFSPANRNTQAQATAFGNTGAPSAIGTNTGQADIAESQRMLQESNAALQRTPTVQAGLDAGAVNSLAEATHVDPIKIRLAETQLNGELGRAATQEEILNRIQQTNLIGAKAGQTAAPYNAAATVSGAKAGATMTAGQEQAAPYAAGEGLNRAIAGDYESQHFADPMIGVPYVDTINGDNSITTSGGRLNPQFRPAAATTMASLANGSYMGVGGNAGAVHTLPSGAQIMVPQKIPDNIVRPRLIGNNASDWMTPGGQSGAVPPPAPTPEEIQDAAKLHHKTAYDAVGAQTEAQQSEIDAQQAALEAKKKSLIAQKAQLAHQRVATGPLANAVRAVHDTYGPLIGAGLRHEASPLIDAYNAYQRIQALKHQAEVAGPALIGKMWYGNQ